VKCGRDLFQWIGNRMYYRFTERNDVYGRDVCHDVEVIGEK
jgi:hypothetical protein